MHRKSKKPLPILDENQKIIGYIQRYLKNKKESFIDIVSIDELPTPILNVLAKDTDDNILVDFKANPNWFSKQTWNMEYLHDGLRFNCEVKNTNSLKINAMKTFEYFTRDKNYKIVIKGRNNLFYANNNLIAEAIPADKNPITSKYKVQIYDNEENTFAIVSLLYLFLNT